MSRWRRLPSGYFREFPEALGYVFPRESDAYWWLTRQGRSLVEGTAPTVEAAQAEVEKAASEFLPA